MRFFTGLFKPSLKITGTDFAGQVEANVKLFKVGDRVMGFGDLGLRSHAQYLTLREAKAVVLIPKQLTYEQAAACLEGAYYALDCVNMAKPKPGQRALVYGSTGAIGSSMVQFLKFYSVSVTAICGGENRKLVTSLGADKSLTTKQQILRKTTTCTILYLTP
jgi:NADPH:quinone reductase-like Zn-dependent oxidoreductase